MTAPTKFTRPDINVILIAPSIIPSATFGLVSSIVAPCLTHVVN